MGSGKKPTGTKGAIEFKDGKATFRQMTFPEKKEDIENQIASSFHDALNSQTNLAFKTLDLPVRNKENDFDFKIQASDGSRFLELMEIAPLGTVGKTHDEAPGTLNIYDSVRPTFEKIMGKSNKYKTKGIVLLLYVTNFKFVLSPTGLTLLRFWCAHESHCFEKIFSFMPMPVGHGIIEQVFPAPNPADLVGFDPEQCRGAMVISIDPRSLERA